MDYAPVPVEHRCIACGTSGAAAVLAYPYDGGPMQALCADCARETAHLRALIRVIRTGQMTVVAPPNPARWGHAD